MKESKFKLNDKVYMVSHKLLDKEGLTGSFNRAPKFIQGKIVKVIQSLESEPWSYNINYDRGAYAMCFDSDEGSIFKSKKEAIEAVKKEYEEYCATIDKILGINKK